VITAVLAGSVGLALAAGPTALAAARPQRIDVANAQPTLARAKAAGAPSSRQKIDVQLYLTGRNQAALEKLAAAVSTPGNASYGKFISAADFHAEYAPASSAVTEVKKFLTGAGLTITQVPGNRAYVRARGTVAQVQKAFDTTLKSYTADGSTFRAAAHAPTVPAALSGKVYAVSGLASRTTLMTSNHVVDGEQKAAASSLRAKKTTTQAPPPDAFVNAPPLSDYYGQKVANDKPPAYGTHQPYAPKGYTPPQLQGAYGLTVPIEAGINGRGVTVAITDAYAAPTILADANTYATKHGQKAFSKGQFTQVLPASFRYGYDDAVNGDQCGEQGWYGEETLDVEAVHAVAPGAKVKYVASPSCDNADFADTINKIVDGHLADIVSNSWGGTDESNGSAELDAYYESIFEQAAVQGIGFYFSSGDSGDGAADNSGTPTVQAPANSPFVTAVGGTSLAVGKSDQKLWETGWSSSRSALSADGTSWDPAPPGTYQYGAGGGTSRVFPQPAYQRGVVPASLSTRYSSTPARVVPDVAAVGDPNTGMRVGETQTFPDGTEKYSEYRIGGTSLAAPLFAGVMALADQVAHHPHGFANPALYASYKLNSKTGAFYDPKQLTGKAVVRNDFVNTVDATGGITTSLRSIAATNGTILRTADGYDDITGVGTPRGVRFLATLAFFRH
jgi:subtilase family serine protease